MFQVYLQNILLNNFIILGIHLGHYRNKTVDRGMHKFFVGNRHKLELFSGKRVLLSFLKFFNFYLLLSKSKAFYLFTITFEHSNKLLYEFTEQTKHSCFTHIWIGGVLTNTSIGQYDLICREQLPYQKFMKNNYPSLIFMFNVTDDNSKLLNESYYVNVPVVGFLDSYNRVKGLEYFVVGNNDSEVIILFYLYVFFFLLERFFSHIILIEKKYKLFVYGHHFTKMVKKLSKVLVDKKNNFFLYLYIFFKYKFWIYRRKPYANAVKKICKKFIFVDFFKNKQLIYLETGKKIKKIVNYYKYLFLKTRLVKNYKYLALNNKKKLTKLSVLKVSYSKYLCGKNFIAVCGSLKDIFLPIYLNKLKNKIIFSGSISKLLKFCNLIFEFDAKIRFSQKNLKATRVKNSLFKAKRIKFQDSATTKTGDSYTLRAYNKKFRFNNNNMTPNVKFKYNNKISVRDKQNAKFKDKGIFFDVVHNKFNTTTVKKRPVYKYKLLNLFFKKYDTMLNDPSNKRYSFVKFKQGVLGDPESEL